MKINEMTFLEMYTLSNVLSDMQEQTLAVFDEIQVAIKNGIIKETEGIEITQKLSDDGQEKYQLRIELQKKMDFKLKQLTGDRKMLRWYQAQTDEARKFVNDKYKEQVEKMKASGAIPLNAKIDDTN